MSRCWTAGDVEILVATEYRGGVDLTVQDNSPGRSAAGLSLRWARRTARSNQKRPGPQVALSSRRIADCHGRRKIALSRGRVPARMVT